MLQVDRTATRHVLTVEERTSLRAHFDARRWLKLPQIIDARLLEDVQRRVAASRFVEKLHAGVSPPSVDLVMEPNEATELLTLVFNDAVVFRDIEAITGCGAVSRFVGFVYRMTPELGHHHNWHNDLIEDRMIAMSVNLGPGSYEGGVLQLRDAATKEILGEVPNTGPGDAAVFALDPSLQHRVLGVTAGVKTAFVGWFCAGEKYPDILRRVAGL